MTWNADGTVPMTVLAHNLTSREDVPGNFAFAAYGAGAAVAASLLLLTVLWRSSRYRDDEGGIAVPRAEGFATSKALRGVLAVGMTGALALALWAGASDNALQAEAGLAVVSAIVWLLVAPASLLFGPIWRFLSPLRGIHAALAFVFRLDRRRGFREIPQSWGLWPAAFALLAYLWLELLAPSTADVYIAWFVAYATVQVGAALLFGSQWFAQGDGFEVASRSWAALSPWRWQRRSQRRRLVVGSPLRTAASQRPVAGGAAVAVVLLGVTLYDQLRATFLWGRVVGPLSERFSDTALGIMGLVYCVALVGLLYTGAMAAAERLAGRRADSEAGDVRPLTWEFAPSLLPIALGYFLAHYATAYLIQVVPAFPFAAGNVDGMWPLTAANVNVPALAVGQLGLVLLGHILGVVLAHDRALRIFPRRAALIAQLPLAILMVAYTTVGLYLLFPGAPPA